VQLLPLRFHPALRVRYEVAGRIPLSALEEMRGDADPLVRERVEERLLAHGAGDGEHTLIEMNLSHRERKRR
jgi:hypothetical protein